MTMKDQIKQSVLSSSCTPASKAAVLNKTLKCTVPNCTLSTKCSGTKKKTGQ